MKIQQWNGGRTRNGIVAGVCGMIGLVASSASVLAQYAVEVKRYEPGTGFATEFGTGVGYTTAASILGEPTRSIPGPFGGPVEPFNPPWQVDQLLSVGTGGVVEIRLDTPATRSSLNPYGIDFLVFGGTGFIITNGDYSGGGITDGSIFGDDLAEVKVSVSADGLLYFTLDGSLAPVLDSLFPTDGSGDFGVPVNPGLTYSDFNGLGLVGIRGLYAGSGGGAGFSLAWARDGDGRQVSIDSASYIRIEVQSGRVELDGVSVVRPVPEPSTWVLLLAGSMGLVGAARRVGRDSSNR
jgi:hypothetical protein